LAPPASSEVSVLAVLRPQNHIHVIKSTQD
jgi:hypothetical protein